MILDKNTASLICLLENRIGNRCHNPNSYNGYTGVYGSDFRYPVTYDSSQDGLKHKTSHYITDIEPEDIKTAIYKFGTNELQIGYGLIDILDFLEDRYCINFNELEASHIEDEKNRNSFLDDANNFLKRQGYTRIGFSYMRGYNNAIRQYLFAYNGNNPLVFYPVYDIAVLSIEEIDDLIAAINIPDQDNDCILPAKGCIISNGIIKGNVYEYCLEKDIQVIPI